ncbi:MAG: hypothetical protein ACHQJ6_05025 [Candidatus Berkiellales bacterium]
MMLWVYTQPIQEKDWIASGEDALAMTKTYKVLMMPKSLTIAEQKEKARSEEMLQFLLEIPSAKNSPYAVYDKVINTLAALEATINKLKGFLRFMAKLNPAEYLRWMQNAFSSYVKINESPTSSSGSDRHIDEFAEVAYKAAEADKTEPKKKRKLKRSS